MKEGLRVLGLALILLAVPPLCGAMAAQSPVFRSRTELVYLPVIVTDRKGKLIDGLDATHFRAFEEGIEQPLSYFGREQGPLIVGLVLDRSGSMENVIQDVYGAALHVLDSLNEGDLAFAITFDGDVLLAHPVTRNFLSLRSALERQEAEGATALFDAIQGALDYLQQATFSQPRKAVCVITDGHDNASVTNPKEMLKRAEEADVSIYSVAMGRRPREWLKKLAEATGGRYHRFSDARECERAMKEIGGELRWRYVLGYYPPGPEGKRWRKVKVTANDGKQKFVARTRQGYYCR